MLQRDFILREIERLGVILNAIKQKVFGGNDNLAFTLENQIEQTKGMLLSEINFNLDKFLDLGVEKSNEYICSFEGFSVENIELLAEYLSQIGFNDKCESSRKYLEKALQLNELCNLKSKTYSFERATKIQAIKDVL
jgi:hypothetical protein